MHPASSPTGGTPLRFPVGNGLDGQPLASIEVRSIFLQPSLPRSSILHPPQPEVFPHNYLNRFARLRAIGYTSSEMFRRLVTVAPRVGTVVSPRITPALSGIQSQPILRAPATKRGYHEKDTYFAS
ncbi:hypothetical protein ANOM_004839 [Aspergillus nomiae NRRL 13137]|uniref:Uncharacterized protein n=1 Tax=Aspergillus nomiae NRRL (strain ATCC 15546 / NRRL 13137 / CBS 260.88 / M93) TaxID=1509407 RepID=A0A0L1J6B1_ASPN3|nr:uncharacterized protein ANOM_004839 [Aspergillus nomiae NRRL 13137]KNG87225.1 hypothetical protein ANOM_004839 [Aspergillus nomiae NRRL 13137]